MTEPIDPAHFKELADAVGGAAVRAAGWQAKLKEAEAELCHAQASERAAWHDFKDYVDRCAGFIDRKS